MSGLFGRLANAPGRKLDVMCADCRGNCIITLFTSAKELMFLFVGSLITFFVFFGELFS